MSQCRLAFATGVDRFDQPTASHTVETDLEATLISSISGDTTFSAYRSRSGEYASCDEVYCNWTSVNTLAVCYSANDVSSEITQEGGHAILPDLRYLLPSDEDPPSLQSGTYMYVPEGSVPRTSTPNGGGLPNLAEIYVLYYDVCLDQGSEFDKTNLTRWVALKGELRFCIKNMNGEFRAKEGFQPHTGVEVTGMEWSKVTKDGQPAFCSKVRSEKDDFCVTNVVMEHLSYQINALFTANATFSDSNRTDIQYGTEWAQPITRTIFGGSSTPPYCPPTGTDTPHGGWWEPGKVFSVTPAGVDGLGITLNEVSQGLSERFQRQSKDVVQGYVQWQEDVVPVDFYWFILPSVIYALVAGFLVATIVITRNTPFWKSSPLPLLHATGDVGIVGCKESIRKQMKKGEMRLSRAEEGWQLVENDNGAKRE